MTELSDTDRLHNISRATNDDGTIDVELHDFNRTEEDNMVSVEFITPNGDVESEVMAWPEVESDDYKFVRLFEQTGYGIIAAEEACENGVKVKAEQNPWKLHAPHSYTTGERMEGFFSNVKNNYLKKIHFRSADEWGFVETFIGSPLLIILTFFAYPVGGNEIKDVAVGYSMAIWHMLFWALIAAAILLVVL